MPTRKYKAEQIVLLLRQIEVQIANGETALAEQRLLCATAAGAPEPCLEL